MEEEILDIRNFTSKVVPQGTGYDDDEAVGGDSRKRKRVFDEMVRGSEARSRITMKLVSSVKDLVTKRTARVRRTIPPKAVFPR